MKIKASVKGASLSVTNDAGETVLAYEVKDLSYEGDITGLAQAIANNSVQFEAAAKTLVEAFGATKAKLN